MESTRDVRRLIDREIKKGSAPLRFEHIDYRENALQEIISESKLKQVLTYFFRIAEHENLANDMTRNNVYTENHLLRGDGFHRRNNVMERNANYLNIVAYAKRLKPSYEHKTFVETVSCYFSFPSFSSFSKAYHKRAVSYEYYKQEISSGAGCTILYRNSG